MVARAAVCMSMRGVSTHTYGSVHHTGVHVYENINTSMVYIIPVCVIYEGINAPMVAYIIPVVMSVRVINTPGSIHHTGVHVYEGIRLW
jgi:hypothetical protein